MNALLHELGKLTKWGKLLWFSSLLFSSALFIFGLSILVTPNEDDANAFSVEFNSDAESPTLHLEDVNILPTDNFFTTYSPSNIPSQAPSTNEVTSYNNVAYHPSVPPSIGSTGTPEPSLQEDFPTEKPSQSSFTTTTPTTAPTTQLPTLSPLISPVSYPTDIPTSTSRPTASSVPSTTNMPTQTSPFSTHEEPVQPLSTFFNYNSSESSRFGPHSWGNVTVLNSTENYWHEFGFIANECGKGPQSPIDVCTQPVRHCEEYHEFRTKVNNYDVVTTHD